MQIVIDIPDEQIEKSLVESKYIHENEGEKGSVHIAMLYTNAQLEFVDVERKTDFYSCEYKILPKGHGDLIDADELKKKYPHDEDWDYPVNTNSYVVESIDNSHTIIEADTESEGIRNE